MAMADASNGSRQETASAPDAVAPLPSPHVPRRARALIGWMAPNEALLSLVGRRQDIAPTAEQQQQVAHARATVASRAASISQKGAEQAPPPSLLPYLSSLQADTAAVALLSAGWRLAVVDLARICAAQPMVLIDAAEDRTAAADPDDLLSLAAIALPTGPPAPLTIQFDKAQKAWVFPSANPNLRIAGAASAVVNGAPLFGFNVVISPSFLRVARYQSRYLLVDGYHRAHGFLRRGITHVPALVADLDSFEALGLPQVGMLPQEAYLGERPPLVADYLADDVSTEVTVPAIHKTVVIAGLEFQAAS